MEKVITRKRGQGEAYTPDDLVNDILDNLPSDVWEEGKTFTDPECGIGQFLVAIAIRKKELGHKNVLTTIFGSDIMQDNVEECRARLLAICGDTKANRALVEVNIRCADILN